MDHYILFLSIPPLSPHPAPSFLFGPFHHTNNSFPAFMTYIKFTTLLCSSFLVIFTRKKNERTEDVECLRRLISSSHAWESICREVQLVWKYLPILNVGGMFTGWVKDWLKGGNFHVQNCLKVVNTKLWTSVTPGFVSFVIFLYEQSSKGLSYVTLHDAGFCLVTRGQRWERA